MLSNLEEPVGEEETEAVVGEVIAGELAQEVLGARGEWWKYQDLERDHLN